ncbi:PLP-dependent aminotransferase family protein [Mycobacteroides abscessus]|uniref:aminotransferase-like domain-containing protein n=1 Tax=Mycobacteroides abscessus TaxID=36809 RepID=UPI00078B2D9A|nr:PLP-dependent aminotransferase family protein [Mycobacteroides abscessus]AMU20030.1 GntR family transcriptional regulator [Mycobacteroides abscessus]MDO3333412.1 PLP-dependent aminotransferase family protein [Mycobacteroides abscessus subsp. bolletii]
MDDGSSHRQVAEQVRGEILALAPGSRIASHRELVRRFHVSASTVADALSLLAQQGLIESRPGAGSFRTENRPVPRPGDTSWQETALELGPQEESPPGIRRVFDAPGLLSTLAPSAADVVDLNGGYLHPDLQPLSMLTASLARAARRPEAWDRPPPGGLPELRDWFAAELGGGLGRQDILICGAGQSALSTSLRALCQPGDPVLLESPCYPGATAAARAAGLRPIAIPLDINGIRPDRLDEALTHTGARALVVQPVFQNPTGASLTPQRRDELREIARRHRAFLIEDDFARYMAHDDGKPLVPPLISDDPDGTVVHIRSMTKVTSPNLRVGAIAARGPVMARLRAASVIDTMLVPAPLQYTTLEVVTSPSWRRGLATLGKTLKHRRATARDAIAAAFPTELTHYPRGGYHLWVSLPPQSDSRQFAAEALIRGVAITPGDNYFTSGGGSPHIRISYVAAPSPADISEGIRRLEPLVSKYIAEAAG